ncbi:MAG: flippase-like domain-containing protein [Muribaculaceae bacterium]|nr:flippase-like domain-containing protein [Muribaculaceae bacterium]
MMKKALQYILPIALSVLLIWSLFRKVDFKETMEIISHGVDYWWILAAMGISVFSHIFRAIRWRLQLNALKVKTTLMELICSIFGCYALNLVLPRVGEIWRCTFVSQRSKAPLTTVMGSMMADRLSDTIMVIFLTLLTFVAAAPALLSFLVRYPIGEGLLKLLYSPVIWISIVAAIGIIWFVLHKFSDTAPVSKMRKWAGEIWSGFAVVMTMPGKWKFLLLTFGIWGCYFVQLYVAFYAFGFTRELCREPGLAFGLIPCLVAFVLSSIGMAIPSNGGLGPWNIAIMFGLAVYGVPDVEGAAFSILQWSGQTVMLILLGIYTAIWIGATSAGNNHRKTGNGHELL